jgi:hypothetical protein
MPTNNDVSAEVLVWLKEVGDEVNVVALDATSLIRSIARVDAQACSLTDTAELTQKLALAAADFEHMLTWKGASLSNFAGEFLGEGVEGTRKVLRLLEISRVAHHASIEGIIEYKTAGVAICEFKIAPREPAGLLHGIQQNAAMHRDRWRAVERPRDRRAAARATRYRPCRYLFGAPPGGIGRAH